MTRLRCACRVPRVARRLIWLIPLQLSVGCTTRITPPCAPVAPCSVFLIDYGYHTSLVLPRAEHRLVEFAYGEWGWFAMNDDAWYRAPTLIMWSHSGALGMREFAGEPTAATVGAYMPVEHIDELSVSRDAVDRLLGELDGIFQAGGSETVYNATVGLQFVRHPEPYGAFRNCNTVVAEWLERLGCSIHGSGLVADFRVDPACER
jgi:hypothetical protein